jgi:succinoglycan biosynthesis transport protein ExoP
MRPAKNYNESGLTVTSANPEALPGFPLSSYSGPASIDPEVGELRIPLSHYIGIVRRHAWTIASFVAACVLLSFVVSERMQPVYESTATIDVDRQAPAGIVGEAASRMNDNDADQFLATQIKLIQSDSVLRPVANKFAGWLQQASGGKTNNGKPETVDSRIQAAPVSMPALRVSRAPNTYLLLISFRSPDPQLAAEMANAIAGSYLDHTYRLRIDSSTNLAKFMERELEELKAKMEGSGQALAQFEREMNVINPEDKTNILSARLLQLNTEYTNAQAERVKKEAAYKAIQGGSLEAAQVSSQGEALGHINEELNKAEQTFAEVKTTYGVNHPEYRKAAANVTELTRQLQQARTNIAGRIAVDFTEASNREKMLQAAVAETKAEYDRINARSFEYQQRKREADADKTLYDELVRKIREAGINAGFQSNDIRIADLARPAPRPVSPRIVLNVLLAFIVSTLLALGAAFLVDMLDTTIRDPEQVRSFLGTEILGVLPAVKGTRTLVTSAAALGEPEDRKSRDFHARAGYQEAIRSLRNSLLLADFESRIRSILVTSAHPSEGKTTTALQLAMAHASQNHKTLLVDADLRRPSLHTRVGISNEHGLADMLRARETTEWRSHVVPFSAYLNVLPAGSRGLQVIDQAGLSIPSLIAEFAKDYDLVIIDGPPLLGFSETLQMAAAADGVLVVTRAGSTRRKAVATVIYTLTRLRANVLGVVLNGFKASHGDNYSYYGGYYYKSYNYSHRDSA